MRAVKLGGLVLLSALAGPVAAQAPRSAPDDPQAIRGTIQVCEAARGEHRVRLEAGRRYHLTATSDAFDPMLRLLRPGSEEVIAQDDDSGGNLSPRISFAPDRSGDYVVRVSSVPPGGSGDYRLDVTPAGPLPALVARPTRTERGEWAIFEGSLDAGDAADLGRHYDDYELRLAAGESVMIHVQANGPDTVLQLFAADQRGGTPLAENDDGGGGPDPFLFFTAERPGAYVVRVLGFEESATGPYRLRIGR